MSARSLVPLFGPLRVALGLGTLAAATIGGCLGNSQVAGATATTSGAGGSGDATTATTTSGGNAGGMGGGLLTGCAPACSADQICSTSKTCIAKGTCITDGDCNQGLICEPTSKTCVPGGMCGAQQATVTPIVPNLLVVLDRSCSMTEVVSAGKTKWTLAVAALDKLTTDYTSKIRFGITLFPDLTGKSCEQDMIPIPIGPGNEMAMQALLDASLKQTDKYFPKGPCVTPIDTGIQQGATDPGLADPTRPSYMLLLTDGEQSAGCSVAGGAAGVTTIITDLYTNKKVPTFVIGFGAGVNVAQLNQYATAGGVPSSDPMTKFYKAEDQASLDAALATIASQTLSCTFDLASKPPDPANIFVFFDKDPSPIDRDLLHKMGWDYDPLTNKVTFYGTTCDMLKAGKVVDVHVVFGCKSNTG